MADVDTATGSNPFATRFVRPGAVPYLFPEGVTARLLLERLADHGGWGQILGDHGTGKSTLLHTLRDLVAPSRRVILVTLRHRSRRLPAALSDPANLLGQPLVMIDGYQQLSRWQRFRIRRLCRRHDCGLLVTAHASMGLATIFETSTSIQSLQLIVERLLAETDFRLDAVQVNDSWGRCRGNVREALFLLYDVHQSQRMSRP